MENLFIQQINDYNPAALPVYSRDVLAKIQAGDPKWEEMVPPQVAAIIKQRKLLGLNDTKTFEKIRLFQCLIDTVSMAIVVV